MLFVILVRLVLSTVILRYPLAGGILAIFLDYHDLNILMSIDRPAMGSYQQWEKALDLWYLALEAYIALSWQNQFVKYSAFLMFIYRMFGIILFEITQKGIMLVFFPNIFEFFYLAYLIQLRFFKKDFMVSKLVILVVFFVLLTPKLFHEYLLHVNTTHPWNNNKYVKMIINP